MARGWLIGSNPRTGIRIIAEKQSSALTDCSPWCCSVDVPLQDSLLLEPSIAPSVPGASRIFHCPTANIAGTMLTDREAPLSFGRPSVRHNRVPYGRRGY